MLPVSCVCPRCDTTLRVKDRTYLNRPIPCPACRSLLVLALNEDGQLTATPQESAASRTAETSISHSRLATASLSRRMREWAANVTVVSWTATLLVAGMIGLLVWRSDRPRANPPIEITSEEQSVSADEDPPESVIESDPTPEIPLDVPPRLTDPIAAAKSKPAATEVRDVDTPPVDAMTVVKAVPPGEQPFPVAAKPPPPPVDFERALSQPLAAFRQSRAIARLELLELLEELLGVPIRYDADELGEAARQLDEKIAFELQDITVGDVLTKVLDQTGIAYDEERDGLRLRKETTVPGEEARSADEGR